MKSDNADQRQISSGQTFVKNPGQLAGLAEQIAARELSPVELLQRYLDRIAEAEPSVQAWREFDTDRAMATARLRAEEAKAGGIRGPLHGIPVGVKDIIDVEGVPTRCNSKTREAVPPATADAEIVLQLKAQGAIILGKVHTTEFAYYDPSPARNPWNTEHTPGGSSSGSGAAVAAGMVPLALGTQTMASLNRPAAYCGVAAFKPSTRSIPGFGVAPLAASYDTVGFVGARVADVVYAYRAVRPEFITATPTHTSTNGLQVVVPEDPLIDDLSDDGRRALDQMVTAIQGAGHHVEHIASPVSLEQIRHLHQQTLFYEMARTVRHLKDFPQGQVGTFLLAAIDQGLEISAEDYLTMRCDLARLCSEFFAAFNPQHVFLWPAAPGTAPLGLGSTGDPRYIAPWTALGGPMVTVPAGLAANGLPLGCILCGPPGSDGTVGDIAVTLAQACENSPL